MGNIDVDLVSAFFFPLHCLTGEQNIINEMTRRNIRKGSSRFPQGNNELKVRVRSKKKYMYIQGRRIYFYLQVFFVIPKTPANTSWWKDRCGGKCEGTCDPTRYWRLCFHPWERLVISRGQRTECVKPVIRLLKVQGPTMQRIMIHRKMPKRTFTFFLNFRISATVTILSYLAYPATH